MITPREPEEQLDLRAVVRDDELLDRIAAGVRFADGGDPAVAILQALVRDVDRGLADAVQQPLPPAGSRWLRPRRLTLRGTAAAAVIGLGLSVGGVSAAVTGNPFAAYESVAGVFDSSDELPPNAAEIAKWNKLVVAARASVRSGDVATAQAQIEALRAAIHDLDVSDHRRAVLEDKLARLAARLESGGPGKGSADRPDKQDDGRTTEKSTGQDDRPSDLPTEPGEGADPADKPDKAGSGNDPAAENPVTDLRVKDKKAKGSDSTDTSGSTGADGDDQGVAPTVETTVEDDAAGTSKGKGAAPGDRGVGGR